VACNERGRVARDENTSRLRVHPGIDLMETVSPQRSSRNRPPDSAVHQMSLRTFVVQRSFAQCLRARSYYSAHHPPSPTYTPQQQKILSTALSLVPSNGFTHETLSLGAKQAGYLEITHNLFPRGVWTLIEYHLVTQREKLKSVPLEEGLGVGRTIRKLCVERLKGNKEIIARWQEVYALEMGWLIRLLRSCRCRRMRRGRSLSWQDWRMRCGSLRAISQLTLHGIPSALHCPPCTLQQRYT
jgi:hypothetical protein